MVCPECKAEFRPGFTRCSDCGVDLVECLAEPVRNPDAALSQGSLLTVCTTDDQNYCVSICKQLSAADIPFKVLQRDRQFQMHVERGFTIGVPPDSYMQAEEVVRKSRMDFSDEPEDQQIMELAVDDVPIAESVPNDWNLASGNPEDASAEIWREKVQERTWMIELGLRENRIPARTDVLEDGSRRILVFPDDEPRAREIVREIVNGVPPT